MSEREHSPPGVDVTRMSHARAYDYVLGGRNNYAVDREAARQVIALAPDLPALAQAQRRFLLRVTRMCAEAGIRQFLDIGSGILTAPNVHETARSVATDARVVHVDNDPAVRLHNSAVLAGQDGVLAIEADVRDPTALLDHPRLRAAIDLDRPVLVLCIGLFHLVTDGEDPAGIVAALRDRMASGSYLGLSQFLVEGSDPTARAKLEEISANSPAPMTFRPRAEIERFFDRFELLPPGVVDVHRWLPDEVAPTTTLQVAAGVGRRP